MTAETGHAIQVAHKLFAAPGELADHMRRVALAVAQRVDGGILRKLRDAGVGVHGHHQQRATTSGGATVYPRRHPVMAKLLENPSMMSVRSAMPG